MSFSFPSASALLYSAKSFVKTSGFRPIFRTSSSGVFAMITSLFIPRNFFAAISERGQFASMM